MVERGRYRLAALDMDGTLLNTNHDISPYTRTVLERAAAQGETVALSTGRCHAELKEYLETIPGISYVIGENGAWVYDARTRETIRRVVIDDETAMRVLDIARSFDHVTQCFIDGQSYMDCPLDASLKPYHIYDFVNVFRAASSYAPDIRALCRVHVGAVGKINLYFAEEPPMAGCMQQVRALPLAVAGSIGLGLELSPRNGTKADGLRALCAHLGIDVSQVMVVGDGGNDIDVMGAAGLSVAMGNAIPEVEARANAFTEDCDHDGAARAIQRYLLGEDV